MKSRLLVWAGCCGLVAGMGAVTAHAQMGGMAMGSSSGNAASGDLLKQLASEESDIEGAVDAMPADKFTFAPSTGEFKGVRTFAAQAKHLAEANYGFFHSFGVNGMKSRSDIEGLTSKADIEAALKDSFHYAQMAIMTITPANAFTPMSNGAEGMQTRNGVAAACLAHAMDHYGQMVVYLRMNGIVPPASRKGGM